MTLHASCKGCALQPLGSGFCTGRVGEDLSSLAQELGFQALSSVAPHSRGTLKHRVLILLEALGKDEVIHRLPAVGATGRTLNRMIERTKDPQSGELFKADDFLVTNCVNCQPNEENKLVGTPQYLPAVQHCTDAFLKPLLNSLRGQYDVILASGAVPMRFLLGSDYREIKEWRGYVFDSPYGKVVPTYHPSFIQQGNWAYVKVWQHDLLKALYVARNGDIPKKTKFYSCYPSVQDALNFEKEYERAGCPPLAFDIETPMSAKKDQGEDADPEQQDDFVEDDPSYVIKMVSFSFKPFHGITMPWMPPYTDIIKRILATDSLKLVWNFGFDVPRLRYNGVDFGGRIVDGMDAQKFVEPALPRRLKYVATFHCWDMHAWAADMHTKKEWYSVADSDVLLRIWLALEKQIREAGRWDTFDRQFIQLRVVLDKMTKRGLNLDHEVRKQGREQFGERLQAALTSLDALIPVEVKKKHIYKSSEERLRREGKWEEGKMVLVKVLEPKKHEHEWGEPHLQVAGPGYDPLVEKWVRFCSSCSKMRKAAKPKPPKVPKAPKKERSVRTPRKRKEKLQVEAA